MPSSISKAKDYPYSRMFLGYPIRASPVTTTTCADPSNDATSSAFQALGEVCPSRVGLKDGGEIFDKLVLAETGFLTRAPVQKLASMGIFDYQNVFPSHHKLVYQRIDTDVGVHAFAAHWQDFQTLWMKRLLKI